MPTVEELMEKGMPDNFTSREDLSAREVLKAMDENGCSVKRATRDLHTKNRSSRFRHALEECLDKGWIGRTDYGRKAYEVTDKGREVLRDE